MNPDETTLMLKWIGTHVQLLDAVLLSATNGMNEQNKLLQEKLPGLTSSERKIFLDAIRRNETEAERLEALSEEFRAVFEAWLSRQ